MVSFYFRIITLLTLFVLGFSSSTYLHAQCTILQNATPTITLRDRLENFNGSVAMSVAWNPERQLYYTCGGNWWTYGTQATLDNAGNLLLINDGGLDFRGNWGILIYVN
jgi:hypothetical protein